MGGALFQIRPCSQFFDLKVQLPPKSTVRNISLTDVKGTYGAWAIFFGMQEQTTIDGILLKNMSVNIENTDLKTVDVKNLKIENVKVNGKAFSLKSMEMQK